MNAQIKHLIKTNEKTERRWKRKVDKLEEQTRSAKVTIHCLHSKRIELRMKG